MQIYISHKAESQLSSLPRHTQNRIVQKLGFYADQKDPLSFAKKLTDKEGYRFRVGDHRVIFIIKDTVINVVKIEPRDKAYD